MAIVAALGGIAFLVASVMFAWSAREYQLTGQPMPNGKGGFMTFRDGYNIALIFFGFSAVWLLSARRFWHCALQRRSSHEFPNDNRNA
jgi:hypothetical protein